MAEKNKVQFIPQHTEKVCYMCNGTGYRLQPVSKKSKKTKTVMCTYCGGTGIYIQTYYHLIYNGMAFGIDTPK